MKTFIIFLFFVFSFRVFSQETNLTDIEVVEDELSKGLIDFIPTTKLQGQGLSKKRETSIGDTLRTEAGIESTYFGPNASRPVIRGLDGDRIRVLQNGLGTLDASTQSLDHAIPVDVLTIDQVEIFRGPMSLLYGSSAVGGVVNLVTNRIHRVYEEGFFSKLLVQGETVNNGLSSAAHLNYGADNWMFHVDGSTRNLQDIEVPTSQNKIKNSFNKQDQVAAAVSRIFDRGYAGASFTHFNTLYGSIVDDEVKIDMTQNRYEFHSEFNPDSAVIRKWRLKSAYSNYFHKELEGDEVGTTFKNDGHETRLEAFNKKGRWNGISGIHTRFNDFSAVGDEAFLPSTKNRMLSLFTFQQMDLKKDAALRLGGRLEESFIEKEASSNFGSSDEKGFLGWSASLGHVSTHANHFVFESSLSYTERAPTFQELYSNGDHVATGTREIGDSSLRKEKSTAFELILRRQTDNQEFTASLYTQVFNDYIALLPTGAVVGGYNELVYRQVDALFYGVDLSNRSRIATINKGGLILLTNFDWVRARDTDNENNLPRISPARLLLGLEYQKNNWSADVSSQYVSHQTQTAPNEKSTDDFILTHFNYSYRVVGNLTSWDFFFRVRNVFDVEARSAVSFLKDRAPLPGRNFIAGATFQF